MDSKQNAAESGAKRSTSRRDFLKLAGAGFLGALATTTLGMAVMETEDGRKVDVWALSSGAIVHDPNLCVGCMRCETSCTVRNDGKASSYISRLKINRNFNYGAKGVTAAYATADGQHGNFKLIGETCRQCSHPACGYACPVGAITADKKTGARVVNAERCVSCGACHDACPWHIATLDKETKVSTKCLLCDGDPTCVKSCPTGAIKFYPWEEAEALLFGSDATSGATAVSGASA